MTIEAQRAPPAPEPAVARVARMAAEPEAEAEPVATRAGAAATRVGPEVTRAGPVVVPVALPVAAVVPAAPGETRSPQAAVRAQPMSKAIATLTPRTQPTPVSRYRCPRTSAPRSISTRIRSGPGPTARPPMETLGSGKSRSP